MLYGFFIGIGGIISYIYTNNQLYKTYYINMADKKDEWTIYNQSNNQSNKQRIVPKLFYHPFNIEKYSIIQKIHYFFTLIMIICINIFAFESYFGGYTKLYINFNFNYKELIYVPIRMTGDITTALFINSTSFYIYHRLAHTKYLYKYIHKYHHAYLKPEPFDSLIGHPIDHIAGGLCQIFPMYIYKMHLLTFLLYSSLISMLGIYEHSGIKIKYLGQDTIDHHIHHMYPSKNYQAGFPILIWDRLFGTYK